MLWWHAHFCPCRVQGRDTVRIAIHCSGTNRNWICHSIFYWGKQGNPHQWHHWILRGRQDHLSQGQAGVQFNRHFEFRAKTTWPSSGTTSALDHYKLNSKHDLGHVKRVILIVLGPCSGPGCGTIKNFYWIVPKNSDDWYYVKITWNAGSNTFTWQNRAGLSWTLTPLVGGGGWDTAKLAVGNENPYYNDGYTFAAIEWVGQAHVVIFWQY